MDKTINHEDSTTIKEETAVQIYVEERKVCAARIAEEAEKNKPFGDIVNRIICIIREHNRSFYKKVSIIRLDLKEDTFSRMFKEFLLEKYKDWPQEFINALKYL